MNVNQLIRSALGDMGMKIYPNFYSGDDEEYITFSYLDERPEFWADDEPICARVAVDAEQSAEIQKANQKTAPRGGLYGHVNCRAVRRRKELCPDCG